MTIVPDPPVSDTSAHPVALDHLPDCAVLATATGRVINANRLAQARFGDALAPGAFAPWFEHRHGWNMADLPDGTMLGLFRPDADETALAKTMLFATLSHEIRTPLNGIIGMAGLIAMTELTSAQRSWLTAVQDSGQHLLGLLNDILDYAKLQSGKIELETIDFSPVATLQSVAELCAPRAQEKGLEIAVAAHAGVPAMVRGDDGRLRQIILNLASNAVKFTSSGGVLLGIAPTRDGGLRFTVEDTGIGIPADKTETIFDEFAQADSSHTRQFGGTGLGLAIVRKLAEAMGGTVGVAERAAGAGSLFWAEIPLETVAPASVSRPALAQRRIAVVTVSDILFEALSTNLGACGAIVERVSGSSLPRRTSLVLVDHADDGAGSAFVAGRVPAVVLIPQERRDLIETYRADGAAAYLIKPLRIASVIERVALVLGDADAAATAPAANDERAVEPVQVTGLRVLLAEDNPVNALLARSLLARSGCTVVSVANGAEAVAALQDGPYDLVLMDVHMPVMDGYDATRAIRAAGGRVGATPIVALTAAAMEEDRRACVAAGMDDFITKPLDPDRLGAMLLHWGQKQHAA
ncbi:MAG: response regulator [Hyphomonadaceae bacterium]|nr:response regulator [Hyphomonadaceae bacterium]